MSTGERIARGSGPEPTKYDKDRHAKMQLRDAKYGNIKVFMTAGTLDNCCKCGEVILSDKLIICGRIYHGKCFRCEP